VYINIQVPNPSEVIISIKDEGQGISADDQKKMFRKFQKLSARPTGGESSTGLGLSIIKVLVEKLGGKITFESAVGKGTTFYVHLPFVYPINQRIAS
jgi:signal transduction histidine kinase